jgi:RNA exonuclease 4
VNAGIIRKMSTTNRDNTIRKPNDITKVNNERNIYGKESKPVKKKTKIRHHPAAREPGHGTENIVIEKRTMKKSVKHKTTARDLTVDSSKQSLKTKSSSSSDVLHDEIKKQEISESLGLTENTTIKTQAPKSAGQKPKKRKVEKQLSLLDSNWKKLRQTLPPPSTPKAIETVGKRYLSTISTDALVQDISHVNSIVALDCEMVGDERRQSMLARVCIIDESGGVLYDKYVRPTSKVTDYRTRYSGILPHHLNSSKAVAFEEVQAKVAELIKGKVVVGHGLKNDFEALKIEHPISLLRDTAKYHKFKSANGHSRKLKHLVLELLSYAIQDGKKGHDPAIDAKGALDLYLKHRDEWEASLARKRLKRS